MFTLPTATFIAFNACLLISCGGSEHPPAAGGTGDAANGAVTQNLPRANAIPRFWLDQLGAGASPRPEKEIAVPSTTPLVVVGWAVDSTEALAGGVEVVIDQKSNVATYGEDRGDVAVALKNPAFAKSGFRFTLPAGQLSKGEHVVTVRILNKEKTGYFETPAFHVRIE